MSFSNILLERDNGLAYLVLNRPDKINALSRETIGEMILALEELRHDSGSRVIIIRGEGRHFCAGHDLEELVNEGTAAYRFIFDQCSRMMKLLHEVPQPVIAQVHGIATAAGCQLVAACDLAVAADDASFGTPGSKLGLFCSTPAVPLVRAVGRKRALEMLFTARMVPAVEAADWGLVNRVVPRDELEAQVRELAESIAQASPLTLDVGKQSFYAQVDLSEIEAYGQAQSVMAMGLTTEDAHEGITAFLEKRKPTWQGR